MNNDILAAWLGTARREGYEAGYTAGYEKGLIDSGVSVSSASQPARQERQDFSPPDWS